MKLFISWSGEESKAIAQILREELPVVINAIDPFVSSEDIEKGVPWFQNISKKLEESSFGIVCLSLSNLQSKWLYFEAGALASKVTQAHVAPLLIDINDADVKAPFSQFQLTKLEQNDFYKLLVTINRALKDNQLPEETLKRSFAIWWPQFEKKAKTAIASIPKKGAPKVERGDRELLEEILSLVRSLSSNQRNTLDPNSPADLLSLLGGLSGAGGLSGSPQMTTRPLVNPSGSFAANPPITVEDLKKLGITGVAVGGM